MRVLSVIFALFISMGVQAADSYSIRIVTNSIGQVSWQRQDMPVQLQRGDPVSELDQVSTGKDARVILRMNDGSVITVGGSSTLAFTSWAFTEGKDDNSANLELVEGAFRFVTGLITKQGEPDLTVNTPSGSIGVRGTDFWGGYLDDNVLDVILLDGEHKLEIRNDLGVVYITEPGYGVTVTPGSGPAAPVRWSKEKLDRAVKTISLLE